MSLLEREPLSDEATEGGSDAATPDSTPSKRRRSSLSGPLRLELAKLTGQLHVQILLWLVVLAPIALVAAFAAQGSTPSDTLFGRWVHVSGLATPLVVMGFAGQWVFPALAGTVAGDVFAGEDRHGTWPLLHCRSYGRLSIFVAKTLIGLLFPLVCAIVLIGVSLVAGLALVGQDPIVNLSGSLVDAPTGSRLIAEGLLTQFPPILTMAAFALMLSVVTRSSLVAVAGPVVVALVSQLVALLDQPPLLREVLPSGGFTAWRGLWLDQAFLRPIVVDLIANGVFTCGLLVTAGFCFLRRDVALR